MEASENRAMRAGNQTWLAAGKIDVVGATKWHWAAGCVPIDINTGNPK